MKIRVLYPRAQLLFLSVFSLQAEITLCNESLSYLHRRPNVKEISVGEFCWFKNGRLIFRPGTEVARRNQVEVINYPYKQKPMDHMVDFASNWHHLNAVGHAVAASLLYDVLVDQDMHTRHHEISSKLSNNWIAQLGHFGYQYNRDKQDIMEGCWRYSLTDAPPHGWNHEGNLIAFITDAVSQNDSILASRFNIRPPLSFDGADMLIEYKTAADTPDYGFIRVETAATSIEIDTKAGPSFQHHAFAVKKLPPLNCSGTGGCLITISAYDRAVVRLAGLFLNPYSLLFSKR
jgi:hypothetical protein